MEGGHILSGFGQWPWQPKRPNSKSAESPEGFPVQGYGFQEWFCQSIPVVGVTVESEVHPESGMSWQESQQHPFRFYSITRFLLFPCGDSSACRPLGSNCFIEAIGKRQQRKYCKWQDWNLNSARFPGLFTLGTTRVCGIDIRIKKYGFFISRGSENERFSRKKKPLWANAENLCGKISLDWC